MKALLPCAIYVRKSSEEGLEQGFNALDAQREACEAFILIQKEQGWKPITPAYDDGGFWQYRAPWIEAAVGRCSGKPGENRGGL
jgi:hypothetical protein